MQEAENPSGIVPLEYNVVVRPDKAEEKTAGGLLKPDELVERDQHAETLGVLVAMSPAAFTGEDWPDEARPALGKRVVFVRYAGTLREGKDGEDYRVMKDKDVLGVWHD